MTETKESEIMGLTQLAQKYHVTRQAIFRVIKNKQLKAYRDKNSWKVIEKDYQEYRSLKYSREKSVFNGQALFKKEEFELSIKECAKLFGVHEQAVYYMVRTGKLGHDRRGNAIILKYEDCLRAFQTQDEKQQLRFA